jgi:hypothetical protein
MKRLEKFPWLHKLPQLEAVSCCVQDDLFLKEKLVQRLEKVSMAAQAATAGGCKLPLYKMIYFLGEAGAEAGRVSMAAQAAAA